MSTTNNVATNAPESVEAANKGLFTKAYEFGSARTTVQERLSFEADDNNHKSSFWSSSLVYAKAGIVTLQAGLRAYSAPARAVEKNFVVGRELAEDGLWETIWGNGRAVRRVNQVVDMTAEAIIDMASFDTDVRTPESAFNELAALVIANPELDDENALVAYLAVNDPELLTYVIANKDAIQAIKDTVTA